MSDHLPVRIKIDLPFDINATKLHSSNEQLTDRTTFSFCDWKGVNKDKYYNRSRQLVTPVYYKIEQLKNELVLVKEVNTSIFRDFAVFSQQNNVLSSDYVSSFTKVEDFLRMVELVYNELVSVLQLCASEIMTTKKCNVEKCWWDAELSRLKSLSVSTHQAWIAAGRPRSGVIFYEKMRAKRSYRTNIKNSKKNCNNAISDKLYNSLSQKDQQSFWKVWKANFGNKKSKSSSGIRGGD